MKIKIISGGQSGVDAAALRVAKRLGMETGGAMPEGWLTEDGPRPEYAELYGMTEAASPDDRTRTRINAEAGDMTLWLGPGISAFYGPTKSACEDFGKSFVLIRDLLPVSAFVQSGYISRRLTYRLLDVMILNIAGSRESREPGVGEKAEEFLLVFLDSLVKSWRLI
ncbi:MAG: putative molybdenum carrier protein [Paludisphaera borealis]|uniref:YpsA SLOG family protein n=1 Tax=Paludisphaera borealis TaxID=1387353 RepID=UPI00284EBCC6|nr:putative molybdenum carrier protein [Paludisphaera borealis]MDR3622904.1 putative molybdenum carrier protein [Paludisphaera borealis]